MANEIAANGISKMDKLDWITHKDEIIRLSEEKSHKEIAETLQEQYGKKASAGAVGRHLRAWGHSSQLSDAEKVDYCERLLAGEELSISLNDIDKLIRYCAERRSWMEGANALQRILAVKKSQLLDQDPPSQNDEFEVEALELVSTAESDYFGLDMEFTDLEGSARSADEQVTGDPDNGLQIDTDLSDASSIELIAQPLFFNDNMENTEELCQMSQNFFRSQLSSYAHQSKVLKDAGMASVDLCPANKIFWKNVNYAIYYFKVRADDLAWPLLYEAYPLIPSICDAQPLTLLKELFSTLALANHKIIDDSVRFHLLREFKRYTEENYQPSHTLRKLFQRLYNEDCPDEDSTKVLRAMLDASHEYLPKDHDEMLRIHRDLIRLHRRRRNFDQALSEAISLLGTCELMEDEDLWVRLALTEIMHIQKDQGQLEPALMTAHGILKRARRSLGQKFPDERAIYTMEDIADILYREKSLEDCIDWLTSAQHHGRSLWQSGSLHSIKHIDEKLAKINKEARQSLTKAAWVI